MTTEVLMSDLDIWISNPQQVHMPDLDIWILKRECPVLWPNKYRNLFVLFLSHDVR